MDRRELLKMIAVVTGGALIGGSSLLTGCERPGTYTKPIGLFKPEDQEFLDEVADTILPATQTPGAKSANVGSFMALMVTDCYEDINRKIFYDGIDLLDTASEKVNGVVFMKATPEQRHTLLVQLDQEAREHQQKMKEQKDLPAHYFTMMKQLTLVGYFSSETGCTKALRYTPVPGRYDGSVPYKKGDKAWA
ncbi:gluconate 2-dehydrogenase subunit 3 family protein [Pedobacter antarcticus]|uniref:gluconate 2-dehydrogenase subunit 3 family protein n=1 Tax=Pedobacter antarcticus TaxID=34086 RepID=UPI0008835397|nr:gluconate 2-dehydrogenase subunit 3 family protein [Pedobacter antarcticus]SDL54259.1 Gluconate 2-dehydrogenase subunit 3 [Pedobacter antarcticus]